VSLGLPVWLAIEASDDAAAPVLAVGLVGSLLTAAALLRPVLLGLALGASGAAYGVLLVVDQPPLDARATGVAAVLLVTGELVGWARELAATTRDEPGGAWRRPIWIAWLTLGAIALSWTLLAVVDHARVEGLAVEAVGALAALVLLLLLRRAAPSGKRD
jgi:hypothetical protein